MKNRIIHKNFMVWQWEEEEDWLNSMAAQGWHLVGVKLWRYEFEKGEPGLYQYRLEALESADMGSKKNQEYLSFVRDMGAEYIGHVLYWAYFRKAADDEPFELFSDIDSKLKHMARFEKLPLYALPLTVINLFNCMNLMVNLDAPAMGGFLLGFNAVLMGVLCYGAYRMREKRRALEEERQLHE